MSIAKVLHIRVSVQQQVMAGSSRGLLFRFIITLLVGVVILSWLKDLPSASILLVDALFCWFCATAFTHRLRYLFLLHPLVNWVLSLFYQTSFLELGDGKAYFAVIKSSLSFYTGLSNTDANLLDMIQAGRFKDLSLGIIPTFLIPDYLYGNPSENIYFLWQACFYVILVSLCLVLAKQWGVMRDEYLFFVILFAIISPSFFELGNAPTRHYVTFISLLLFYVSFMAFVNVFSIARLVWLLVAGALIMVSKNYYFIPISVFVAYYLLLERRSASGKVWKYVLVVVLLVLSLYTTFTGPEVFSFAISNEGAATFGFLANIPIVSFFAKYIYALLSPFPWQNAAYFIATIYGGNSLHFVMHVLSSLTGLYLFSRVIIYARPLFRTYPDLKTPVIYGLIISLSILRGWTGFHSYLIVVFPFLAPLFAIRRYQLSWMVPVAIALGVESIYSIAKTLL